MVCTIKLTKHIDFISNHATHNIHIAPYSKRIKKLTFNANSSVNASVIERNNNAHVKIENGPNNSRIVYGIINIHAPIEIVWQCLTDYENLSDFIPSLKENKCLERKPHGAILQQIGQQNLALGIKFCAEAILDVGEHIQGLSNEFLQILSNDISSMVLDESLFLTPKLLYIDKLSHPRDITFSLIKGDLKQFKGLWRMHSLLDNINECQLIYSVLVRPQQWLPVGLIQGIICNETNNNLIAVKNYAEKISKVDNI